MGSLMMAGSGSADHESTVGSLPMILMPPRLKPCRSGRSKLDSADLLLGTSGDLASGSQSLG
jgi:hypothetical protein